MYMIAAGNLSNFFFSSFFFCLFYFGLPRNINMSGGNSSIERQQHTHKVIYNLFVLYFIHLFVRHMYNEYVL